MLVPAGTYAIRGHLVVPPNTELRGVNNFPYRNYGTTGATNVGTTLQAYEGAGDAGGDPFILLQGSNAGLAGMSIVYPEQAGPDAAEPVEGGPSECERMQRAGAAAVGAATIFVSHDDATPRLRRYARRALCRALARIALLNDAHCVPMARARVLRLLFDAEQ